MINLEDIFGAFLDYISFMIIILITLLIIILLLFSAQVGLGYMELNRVADIIKDEGDKAGYFSSTFYNNEVNAYFEKRGTENTIKVESIDPGFDVKPTKIGDISKITLTRDAGFYKIMVPQRVVRVVVNRGYFGEGY